MIRDRLLAPAAQAAAPSLSESFPGLRSSGRLKGITVRPCLTLDITTTSESIVHSRSASLNWVFVGVVYGGELPTGSFGPKR